MPVIIPMVVQHSAVEENESEPSTPVVLEAPAPPPTPPTPHLDGLSLRYLSQLSKSLPSGRDWSLRQIVERLVLPATAARKCAFVETLQGSDAIGEATYFVAMDWETPFASTIESLLNHVNQMDAYVLISVLAFSLWSEVAFHTTTLSDFDHRKSSSSSFGSSRNGITAAPLMLDADQFVSHITHTLVNSERRQSLTLLLCLDELLVSLGRILPMHAAWAAMRGGVKIEIVPFNSAPGRLTWPRQTERCPTTGAVFRLLTADAPDSRIREALIKDMKAYHHISSQPHATYRRSSSPAEQSASNVNSILEVTLSAAALTQDKQKWKRGKHSVDPGSFEHHMEIERRRLWRTLMASATGQQETGTQSVVKAAFLSMDGRYSESKAVLLGILNGDENLEPVERAHILILLAEVRLHMGQPLHAHNHSLEALHLLNDLTQPLASSASSLPSFPTILLSRSTTIDGSRDYGRSSTSSMKLPSNPGRNSGRSVQLSDNIQWGRTCLARSLELLNEPGQAEEIFRQMFILLDQQEGPRAPRTLRMMSYLGRNLSFFQGRHEEGAILLRECLKSAKHAVNIWAPRQQILVTHISRIERSFSSPNMVFASMRESPSRTSDSPSNSSLDQDISQPSLTTLHMKVSVLSCDIASAFSHMSREEKRDLRDQGIMCHGGGGGAPMSCSMTIITSFRAAAAAAASKDGSKKGAGQKFLPQNKKSNSGVGDLLVDSSPGPQRGSRMDPMKRRNSILLSAASNLPSKEINSGNTHAMSEEVLLFDQACSFMEAACGVEHESSCLMRARAAAGAIAAGPAVRSSGEYAAEGLEKESYNRHVSSFLNSNSDPFVALVSSAQRNAVGSPTQATLDAIEAIRFEAECLVDCIGPHHAYAIDVRTLLAEVLESQLLYQAALEEWRVVIAGRRAQCDQAADDNEERGGSVLAAQALTQLAHCQSQLGKNQEAASTLIEAAAEFASATGRRGIQTGQALFRVADAQRLVGDYVGAERSLSEAVEAYELKYGRNNWRTKEVRMACVECIEAQGRSEMAEQLMTEYRLKKSIHGREEEAKWRSSKP